MIFVFYEHDDGAELKTTQSSETFERDVLITGKLSYAGGWGFASD
jgi:hypothetical protein